MYLQSSAQGRTVSPVWMCCPAHVVLARHSSATRAFQPANQCLQSSYGRTCARPSAHPWQPTKAPIPAFREKFWATWQAGNCLHGAMWLRSSIFVMFTDCSLLVLCLYWVYSSCIDVLGNFEVPWLCTTTEDVLHCCHCFSICVFIDSFRARDDQMGCECPVNDSIAFSFYFEQK